MELAFGAGNGGAVHLANQVTQVRILPAKAGAQHVPGRFGHDRARQFARGRAEWRIAMKCISTGSVASSTEPQASAVTGSDVPAAVDGDGGGAASGAIVCVRAFLSDIVRDSRCQL
jgi:hypothetical protein